MPADHAELPVWNAENWFFEDFEVGHKIRSLRRTISEGESMQFNALVLDMHPYVADQMFAEREGIFGKRLVAGAFVFSAGLGLVATNCVNAFSYGYDKLRFIRRCSSATRSTRSARNLAKWPKYKEMGMIRASYQVYKGEGELVMYCEHLQTVKYRDAAAFADVIGEKRMSDGLLEGVLVLDMSQFLSGPFAALRLGDLGARVIKIERPDGGDLCRRLYLTDTEIGGDSTLFHAINRGKQGFSADFKNADDVALVKTLIAKRRRRHPEFPPRRDRPARARLRVREGDQSRHRLRLDHRLRRGRPVGDAAGPGSARAGARGRHVAERRPRPGARAVRPRDRRSARRQRDRRRACSPRWCGRGRTGDGAHIETSLLEALVDFQFEVLTTYLNDGGRMPDALGVPQRARLSGGALWRLPDARRLARARHDAARQARRRCSACPRSPACPPSAGFDAPRRDQARDRRPAGDADDQRIGSRRMQPADIWCAEVLDWPALFASEAFQALDMLQIAGPRRGRRACARRARRSGSTASARRLAAAPRIGEHNAEIRSEFGL